MGLIGTLALAILAVGDAFAQTGPPPASPHKPKVVRVQIGYGCGWCIGGGYRSTLTTVNRWFVKQSMGYAYNPKEFPDHSEKHPITEHQWRALVNSIDARALKAVPQQQFCRPCIDRPDAWVVVEYSDGATISVHYAPGGEPDAVRAMKIPDAW